MLHSGGGGPALPTPNSEDSAKITTSRIKRSVIIIIVAGPLAGRKLPDSFTAFVFNPSARGRQIPMHDAEPEVS